MTTVLIVGGTRGLGLCLAKQYAAKKDTTVFATSRSASPPEEKNIHWIPNIDLMSPGVGDSLVNQLGGKGIGGGGGGIASGINPIDIVASNTTAAKMNKAKIEVRYLQPVTL